MAGCTRLAGSTGWRWGCLPQGCGNVSWRAGAAPGRGGEPESGGIAPGGDGAGAAAPAAAAAEIRTLSMNWRWPRMASVPALES